MKKSAVIIHAQKKLDDTSSELVGSVTKIIDGDTIQLLLDDTPMVFRRISCRLRGIDTPELRRSRCCIEKCLAKIAKEFVESLIPKGSVVKLLSPAKGKYFRLIANISTEKGDLSNILEQIGLAVKYNGYGKRYDWCAKPYQVNTAKLIRDRCEEASRYEEKRCDNSCDVQNPHLDCIFSPYIAILCEGILSNIGLNLRKG